ncbi:DUF1499 domain-containing protein [Roseobacter sp. HKCCD7870]|uniref:DUF1499 domain-containing protein n=1 Tax=Roseobacter sp. HKCCD7870 TaxID=3120343 RepID=UPI0030EDF138
MLFKLFISAATLFGIVIFAAVACRVMPMDAMRYHIRPALAVPPSTPNFALMVEDEALVLPRNLPDVAADVALKAASDGAVLLAGRPEDGFVTYVYRSRLMGFPDALSLTLDPTDEGGTRVQIFSRSRFGYSDLGVNAARVADWVAALQAAR